MPKTNTHEIKNAKGVKKLVMITAYDALFARLLHESADILLVGDSLAMSFGGHADTLAIGLDEMIYHTKAVCKGAPEAFVVLDMPFGTYPDEKNGAGKRHPRLPRNRGGGDQDRRRRGKGAHRAPPEPKRRGGHGPHWPDAAVCPRRRGLAG